LKNSCTFCFLRFSIFIHDATHKSEKLKYDQRKSSAGTVKGGNIQGVHLLCSQNYVRILYFFRKMEILKVFIKTEEEEEKGKEDFHATHTISARINILF
jgi:hypothetical protein